MKKIKTALIMLLALMLAASAFSFAFAEQAGGKKRIVKVGCINHPGFAEHDENGKLVGYGVEYMERLCDYTDWQVEFVFDTWENRLNMLRSGEIDIVPYAGIDDERAEEFIFSEQSIGNAQYVLIVRDDNSDIYYEDFEALDGKTIGVQRGSGSTDFLDRYSHLNNFTYKLKEFDLHEDGFDALMSGEIDALTCEQMASHPHIRVVGHFGSAPLYLMCNRRSVELMEEIDNAMNHIYSRDAYFRTSLYKKYYGHNILNSMPTFTCEELSFIEATDEITIALVPDNQPNAYLNERGEIVGIVYETLQEISRLCNIRFKFVLLPKQSVPISYLDVEPDCLLGGVVSTNPAFRSERIILSNKFYTCSVALLARGGQYESIDLENGSYTVGLLPHFQALQLFIEENYPNLIPMPKYNTIAEGLHALENGEVDLFSYDLNTILHYWGNPHYRNSGIVSPSFMEEPLCVAGLNNERNAMLIGIINKCIAVLPEDTVERIERAHLSLNYYQPTIGDLFYQLRFPLLSVAAVIVIVFIFMFVIRHRDRRNAAALEQKNRQLADAAQRAEAANLAKSEFLSRMSHDIRTPMNAIMGMTALAKSEVGEKSIAAEYLDKVEVSSNILLQLLNDILDSAAIESGHMKVSREAFSLDSVLDTIVNLYTSLCEERGVRLITDIDAAEGCLLLGDPLRLSQVLLNLMSNACKFTPKGGSITLSVKELERSESATRICFTVSDTGCGIDEEMLGRLFEPFEQKDATTAHKYGGSGLGLSIVKNLVTLMGGTVSVDSKLQEGASFVIDLPFETVAEEAANEPSGASSEAADKEPAFDLTGKHFLVVDDDTFNREVVEGLLKLVNASSTCVEDGEKALKAFEVSVPGFFDAILMDVHMPVMDGYEATKAIRASAHSDAGTIPIFALTADAFPQDIEKAHESGMNGHLSKPIYPNELYGALSDAE